MLVPRRLITPHIQFDRFEHNRAPWQPPLTSNSCTSLVTCVYLMKRTQDCATSSDRPTDPAHPVPESLSAFKPPATLMWLPAYFEYGIARYFR